MSMNNQVWKCNDCEAVVTKDFQYMWMHRLMVHNDQHIGLVEAAEGMLYLENAVVYLDDSGKFQEVIP